MEEGEKKGVSQAISGEVGLFPVFKSQRVLSALQVCEVGRWDSLCSHLQEGKLRFRGVSGLFKVTQQVTDKT